VSAGWSLGRQASWTACILGRGMSHFRAGCLIECAPRKLLAKGGSARASHSHRCQGRAGDAGTMPEIGKSDHSLFQRETDASPANQDRLQRTSIRSVKADRAPQAASGASCAPRDQLQGFPKFPPSGPAPAGVLRCWHSGPSPGILRRDACSPRLFAWSRSVVVKRGLNPNRPIRFHRQRAADFRGLKDRRPRGLRHSAHPASGR